MDENPSFWDKNITPPDDSELKNSSSQKKRRKLIDDEEVSFTFQYYPRVLSTIYGPTLNRGEIIDSYYGIFRVPEGGRGLPYAVIGIYLI